MKDLFSSTSQPPLPATHKRERGLFRFPSVFRTRLPHPNSVSAKIAAPKDLTYYPKQMHTQKTKRMGELTKRDRICELRTPKGSQGASQTLQSC